VSHRLVMTAQVRDWLHALRSGDPGTRRLVAGAIDRLIERPVPRTAASRPDRGIPAA
jgi:hypothetical protein